MDSWTTRRGREERITYETFAHNFNFWFCDCYKWPYLYFVATILFVRQLFWVRCSYHKLYNAANCILYATNICRTFHKIIYCKPKFHTKIPKRQYVGSYNQPDNSIVYTTDQQWCDQCKAAIVAVSSASRIAIQSPTCPENVKFDSLLKIAENVVWQKLLLITSYYYQLRL